jgi:hypothetical protein
MHDEMAVYKQASAILVYGLYNLWTWRTKPAPLLPAQMLKLPRTAKNENYK